MDKRFITYCMEMPVSYCVYTEYRKKSCMVRYGQYGPMCGTS